MADDAAAADGSYDKLRDCVVYDAASRPAGDHGSDSCLLELLPTPCWSIVVDKLAARDLLRLSLASKALQDLSSSTPGLWTQACLNSLGPHMCTAFSAACSSGCAQGASLPRWNATHSTPLFCRGRTSGLAPQAAMPKAVTTQQLEDQQAQQLLKHMMSLAHATSTLKPQLKPQTYLLPPWLPAQPGKARGFVRVECPAALSPGLQLSADQVHLLSWGCLSDHSGGVFVSQCTSSPRSRQACGFMAAVVINKQLLAELYLPSGCTAAERWSSLYQPPAAGTAVAAGRTHATALDTATAGTAGADAVQFELWVNQMVSFDDLDVSEQAGNGQQAALAGARHRSRRQHRSRPHSSSTNRFATSSTGSIHWSDVHALLMECIAGNAARCRAVAGTALVPPGTSAAAEVEQQLAGLAALGAPVLDLRRLQYCSSPTSSTGVMGHPVIGSIGCSSRTGSDMQRSAGRGNAGNCSCMLPNGFINLRVSAGTAVLGAAGASLTAMQQHWCSKVAAVQEALSAAVAEKATAAIAASNPTMRSLDDDSLADVLAAVVQQLHTLAPEVRVLVLPVLLPGGRVGHKVPGGRSGSSKLSAPRLLSLNVPYLVPLRHEWDQLQHLKQVLLMVGPPAAVRQPPAAEVAGTRDYSSRPEQGFHPPVSSDDRDAACANQQCQHAACGSGKQLLLQLQQQQQQKTAAGEAVEATRPLVKGVFSLQQLEQHWQQQALIGQSAGLQQGQGGQYVAGQQQHRRWDDAAWFQQQLARQEPDGVDAAVAVPEQVLLQCKQREAVGATHSDESNEQQVSPWGKGGVLPGYALEAVQGMLLSCMDRLAPTSGFQRAPTH